MDQAVYASGASVIVGIRGNRVFQCNPTTGAVQNQVDLPPFGWGKGSIAYDPGSNKIFAACWNTPHYNIQHIAGFNQHCSQRNLYRVNPATLAIEITADIQTSFSLGNQNGVLMECGFDAMDSAGGNIYVKWWATPQTGPVGGTIQFSAASTFPGPTFVNGSNNFAGDSPNLSYGSVGGVDSAIYCDQSSAAGVTSGQMCIQSFAPNSVSTFNTNPTNAILSCGFAPTQQHIFVTDVNQFIYVYTVPGVLAATIDTTHSAFNGLAVRYDSTDGNIYIPGGNDNTMAVINPATNALTLVAGFDCPVDYVRAGSTRFAVQAGSTPLKAF